MAEPSRPRVVARWLLVIGMVAIGITHFTSPDNFVRIMPPYLPWHLGLVYLSGVFEILGGLGLIPSRTRSMAGYGLIALYVAVFPANLHMALNNIPFGDAPTHPFWVWARLPVQALLIAWAYWVSRPSRPRPSSSSRPDQ